MHTASHRQVVLVMVDLTLAQIAFKGKFCLSLPFLRSGPFTLVSVWTNLLPPFSEGTHMLNEIINISEGSMVSSLCSENIEQVIILKALNPSNGYWLAT